VVNLDNFNRLILMSTVTWNLGSCPKMHGSFYRLLLTVLALLNYFETMNRSSVNA